MAIKLGIKLWSSNSNWFAEAVELYRSGVIALIELYIVPGTVTEQLTPLLNLPVRIHAPHENDGFNAFALTDDWVQRFQLEVSAAANVLHSPTIVVHAGVGQDDRLFAKQIARLHDERIIIENMPYVALDHRTCYGYSFDQLAFIHRSMKRGLCLDLGHAVKSAMSQGLEYKVFINDIVTSLEPSYFHVSDGKPTTDIDEHLNLGHGSYDLLWMKRLLDSVATSRDIMVIFEVPKNGVDLGNDVTNARYWRQLQ